MEHKYKDRDFVELNNGEVAKIIDKRFPIEGSPEYTAIVDVQFTKKGMVSQLYRIDETQIKGIYEKETEHKEVA